MEEFETFVKQNIPISSQDWALFQGIIRERQVKKNELWLVKDQVCRKLGFVTSGLLKMYELRGEKEVIGEFYSKNWFATDYFSFVNQIPSRLFIQALEDSTVLEMSKADVTRLYDQVPLVERFGRIMAEAAFSRLVLRIDELHTLSPTERYQKLLSERPALLQQVPQYMIASYIGVTDVGLSKIRARSFKK